MRVIGGSARGRRLVCPVGDLVRPVPDLARSAIFNILRDQVEGAVVLDLFAGAGTMGIEALSRGAAQCAFVERSARACAALRKNLDCVGLASRAEVVRGDALRCLPVLKRLGWTFTIAFACPPFALYLDPPARAELIAFLEALLSSGLLASGARVILQHEARSAIPAAMGGLVLTDRRRYGRNVFSFYEPSDIGVGGHGNAS